MFYFVSKHKYNINHTLYDDMTKDFKNTASRDKNVMTYGMSNSNR